jgi:hypothetical protein
MPSHRLLLAVIACVFLAGPAAAAQPVFALDSLTEKKVARTARHGAVRDAAGGRGCRGIDLGFTTAR